MRLYSLAMVANVSLRFHSGQAVATVGVSCRIGGSP